jgi:sulfur-oxidizing protein SoxY
MMPDKAHEVALRRRDLLVALSTGALGMVSVGLVSRPAEATPETMRQAIQKVIGERHSQEGKITLRMPQIVDNGRTVPITVAVESPMTDRDYVEAIHVFTERNPRPEVASYYLSPRAGKAEITTRMRLAMTQHVIAIAIMHDGSVYQAATHVKVTIGSCYA